MAPMEHGRIGTPYSFDRIFDQNKTTLDIFEEICKPVITGAVNGFHGTVFAYGQSSSGKTFTMTGSYEHPGIISLSVDEIFRQMKNASHKEFLLRISYMEIYNERVSDLLSSEDKPIRIQEDMDRNIQLTGVCEELVMSQADVNQYMKLGNDRKHMAETKQNDRSSRSHCIMRMIIESRETGDEDAVMVSHLNFVDLAGSEKAHENSGDRYKEGCAINKSLFMLGTVISKLSDGIGHQHIGYRDSKLTRILQNALGGNSKTAIIATITPASLEESHSTLRFASRAKTIKNQPHINETLSDAALLKRSRKEIHSLQQKINELESMDVLIEKEELQKKLEDKMEAERKQTETIEKLKQFIIKAGTDNDEESNFKKLKRRRETWCPGKANAVGRDMPGGKFARDLNGRRIDVEMERPFIPKSFVTSRKDESNLPDISEMSSLADISPPMKDDSIFTDLSPKFGEFPPQKQKHVSFRSPDKDCQSPPFSDYNEFEQMVKDYKDLQDSYEELLLRYEEKCYKANEDESYIKHELEYVKEHVTELKNNKEVCNNKMIEELQSSMKQLQNEKNDLTDEVVLLQHRLSIQNRKVQECQQELDSLRTQKEETPKDNSEDLQMIKSQHEEEVKKMISEKEKLETDLSDLRNINEEFQHQQETSLEMYIMKIQELEEKLEDSDEKLNTQIDEIHKLKAENTTLQDSLKQTELKLSELSHCKEEVQIALDEFKQQKHEELSEMKTDDLNDNSNELANYKLLVNEKEQRIGELEKEVLHLYSKIKEHCGVEGQRRSTADELSDVLKEHCDDLENRLKEIEIENGILKEKLQKSISAVDEPRRSTADELSDVLKEHCEDLENRLKELQTENDELKESVMKSSDDVDVNEMKEQIVSLQNENDSLKSHTEDLEKQIASLSDKLIDGNQSNRKSTAEELSDVLKEHCTDLETRLREIECENDELKQSVVRYTADFPEDEKARLEILESEKKELRVEMARIKESHRHDQEKIKCLQRELVSFGEKVRADSVSENNRRSVEVELADVYKEHCQDLETRMEEIKIENRELSERLSQLKSENEISKSQQHELEVRIKELESENLQLQDGLISNTCKGSLAEELSDVVQEQRSPKVNDISNDHSQENGQKTSLDMELDTDLAVASDSTHDKEGTDKVEPSCDSSENEDKIHQLEDQVQKLTLLLKEKSETTLHDQNVNEQESGKCIERQQTLEKLQNEHSQCSESEAKLNALQENSNGNCLSFSSVESQTEENKPSLESEMTQCEQDQDRFIDLQDELEHLKSENQSLQETLKRFEEQNISPDNDPTMQSEKLKQDAEESIVQCELLKLELEDLTKKYESLTENNALLEIKRDELLDQIKCLKENVDEDDDKQQYVKLVSELDKLQALNSELTKQIREMESTQVENDSHVLNLEIEKLLEEKSVLVEENKGLLERLENDNESKYKELEDRIVYLKEENKSLMEKLNSNDTSRIEALESKIEELEIENRSLSGKQEDGDASKLLELECKIELLEEENKSLQDKVVESNDTKVQELECKIEALEEENKSLQDKIVGSNDTKVQELECKIEVLEEENKSLQDKVVESNDTKVQELECKIEVLEEENKSLQDKVVESNDAKVQDLECKIEVLEEENKSLQDKVVESNDTKVQELECKIEVLGEENKSLVDKVSKISDMKVQELECKIEVLEEENQSLIEKLDQTRAVGDLECKIHVLEEENQSLLEKLDQSQSKTKTIEELECKIQVLEEENKNLLEKLDQSRSQTKTIEELECKIQLLEEEKTCILQTVSVSDSEKFLSLENRIDTLANEKKCLEEKLESMDFDTMKKELESKVHSLQEENRCLLEKVEGDSLAETTELECRIEVLLEENKCLSDKMKDSDLSLANALEEINTLKQEVELERNPWKERAVEYECKTEVFQEEIDTLTKQLETIQFKLEEAEAKTEVLQEEIDTLTKHLETNQYKLDEAEAKTEVLQEENDTLTKQLETNQYKIDEAEAKTEVLQEENDTLTKQLETNQYKLDEAEAKTEVLQEENDTLYKKVDCMVEKDLFDDMESKSRALQQENECLCKQLQDLENNQQISKNQESKVTELMSEIENLREDKVKLESDLNKASSDQSKGMKKIEDLKDDMEIMKATEKVLMHDNENLLDEISSLQQKYQTLAESEQKKCQELNSEIDNLQQKLSESVTPDVLQIKLEEIDQLFQNKLQEKQKNIDQLSSSLTKTNSEIIEVREQYTKSEDNRHELQLKLQTTEINFKDSQDKLEKLQKEKAMLEEKLKEAESATRTSSTSSLSTSSLNESMSTKCKLEYMDKTAKDKIVKLVIENNKLKDRNKKDNDVIEGQKKMLERLEEQLEKRNRESDLFEELKTAQEKAKQAETEADKFYEKCCKEEAKVSDLEEENGQKSQEIVKLKEQIEKMISSGEYKQDNTSNLKKKFTEIYNELQEAKRKITSMEKEMGDKNLDIYHLQHRLERNDVHHDKKIKAYEESMEMYDQHISKLKDEIRRLGTNQEDNTMVNIQPMKKESELMIGKSSGAGGAVDHFENILLQEDNRRIIKKCTKLENKVKDLQDELAKYHKHSDLERKIVELREEEKKLKIYIAEHSTSRTPLENLNSASVENVKTEPKFKIPGGSSSRKNNDIEEQCNQQ